MSLLVLHASQFAEILNVKTTLLFELFILLVGDFCLNCRAIKFLVCEF